MVKPGTEIEGQEYPEPEPKTENEVLTMLRRMERKLDALARDVAAIGKEVGRGKRTGGK